jgi:peroxidase
MDPLLRGLYGVPAKLKMPREIMNNELTEKLFHITRHISQDLAALNIQVSQQQQQQQQQQQKSNTFFFLI